MTFLPGDSFIWLLALSGPVVGLLLYRLTARPTEPVVAAESVQAAPIEPDPLPVPTQRVGIPPTALVRIQEACGGLIKDGELDIRFELRSRRDCDKMLETMRRIKENLERTRVVFDNAGAEIRGQLDGPMAAAGKNTGRVLGHLRRNAANDGQSVAAKLVEMQGYATATRLIDKFILELAGAELSIRELPFYANLDPAADRKL